MAAKDFLNFKKPQFWLALAGIAVLGYVGVISVQDKGAETPPIEDAVDEEISVEDEEVNTDAEVENDTEAEVETDVDAEVEDETADVQPEPEEEPAPEAEEAELQYISEDGFSIRYPETMQPIDQFGHEGFALKDENGENIVQMIIVPENEMDVDDDYLKEAVGSFENSGEYENVKIGNIQELQADNENVTIKSIEVVYDDMANRFYVVKGNDQTLLVTVTLTAEGLEDMGVRVDQMVKGITFTEKAE